MKEEKIKRKPLTKREKSYYRFVEEHLSKLPENHTTITTNFKGLCKKYGSGFIDYLDVAFIAWKEMYEFDENTMSKEEFIAYNGIPISYFEKLEREKLERK